MNHKSYLVIFCIFLCIYTKAQKLKESEVPLKVKEAFSKKFPNTKVETWQKENIYYEAEFDINKTETSASFDDSGNLIEIESEIKIADLPETIKQFLSKKEPGKKIKEATIITDANGNKTYEAEVNDIDYVFDAQGNFVSKEANKE